MNNTTNYTPDLAEVGDWLVLTRPHIYEAIRYLHPVAVYRVGLQIWAVAGKPDLSIVH